MGGQASTHSSTTAKTLSETGPAAEARQQDGAFIRHFDQVLEATRWRARICGARPDASGHYAPHIRLKKSPQTGLSDNPSFSNPVYDTASSAYPDQHINRGSLANYHALGLLSTLLLTRQPTIAGTGEKDAAFSPEAIRYNGLLENKLRQFVRAEIEKTPNWQNLEVREPKMSNIVENVLKLVCADEGVVWKAHASDAGIAALLIVYQESIAALRYGKAFVDGQTPAFKDDPLYAEGYANPALYRYSPDGQICIMDLSDSAKPATPDRSPPRGALFSEYATPRGPASADLAKRGAVRGQAAWGADSSQEDGYTLPVQNPAPAPEDDYTLPGPGSSQSSGAFVNEGVYMLPIRDGQTSEPPATFYAESTTDPRTLEEGIVDDPLYDLGDGIDVGSEAFYDQASAYVAKMMPTLAKDAPLYALGNVPQVEPLYDPATTEIEAEELYDFADSLIDPTLYAVPGGTEEANYYSIIVGDMAAQGAPEGQYTVMHDEGVALLPRPEFSEPDAVPVVVKELAFDHQSSEEEFETLGDEGEGPEYAAVRKPKPRGRDDYLKISAADEPPKEKRVSPASSDEGVHSSGGTPPKPGARGQGDRPLPARPQEKPTQAEVDAPIWDGVSEKEAKKLKTPPASPYSEDILANAMYMDLWRQLYKTLEGVPDAEGKDPKPIADIVRELRKSLETKANPDQTAVRIIAELSETEAPIPGYNYLKGLGVSDKLYAPLSDLLEGSTEVYRSLLGGESLDGAVEHALCDDLTKLAYLHDGLIKLYLALLAESARHDRSFQIVLLSKSKEDAVGNTDVASLFYVLVKRQDARGNVTSTEYKLNIEHTLDVTEKSKCAFKPVHPASAKGIVSCPVTHHATAKVEESFGKSPLDFNYREQKSQKIWDLVSAANVSTSNVQNPSIVASLDTALAAHLQKTTSDKGRDLSNPERHAAQIELLRGIYTKLLINEEVKKQEIRYCLAYNKQHPQTNPNLYKKPITLTPQERRIAAEMAVVQLGKEVEAILKQATSGFAGWFKDTGVDALKAVVERLLRRKHYTTVLPDFLLERVSASEIKHHYLGQHQQTFLEQYGDALVAGAAVAVIAAGAAGAAYYFTQEGPCEGHVDAEGACVDAEIPALGCHFNVLTDTGISEGGTAQFVADCPQLASVSGEFSFMMSVPAGASVSVEGNPVTVEGSQFELKPHLGKTVSVTLPDGFNGTWNPSATVSMSSGSKTYTAAPGMQVNVMPVAGSATVANLGGQFSLPESGSSLFTMAFRPAAGDSSVLKYVRDLPLGDKLCAKGAGGTVCFESTFDNGGAGELLFAGQDVEITYLPKPGTAGSRGFKLFAKSVDGAGADEVIGAESPEYSASFNVAGQAANIAPEQIDVPAVAVKTVEGQYSAPFNLTASVAAGDTLQKVVELPSGASICGTLQSSGTATCLENTGGVAQEFDISDWDPEVTYKGNQPFAFLARGVHDSHQSAWASRNIGVDELKTPTVVFTELSGDETSELKFPEDTVGGPFRLNINKHGADSATVLVTLPEVESPFTGNFYLNGTLPDGTKVQAIPGTDGIVDISGWKAGGDIYVTPAENVNIGNHPGLKLGVNVTTAAADGREAVVMQELGLGVSPVADDFVFTSRGDVAMSAGASTVIFGRCEAAVPGETLKNMIVIDRPLADTRYDRSELPGNPDHFDKIVDYPDGTYGVSVKNWAGFGFLWKSDIGSQAPQSETVQATACVKDGEAERCKTLDFKLTLNARR